MAKTAHPADADKMKPPRQRRTSGVSLKGLLRTLKTEGFFGQARSRAETEARLKDKGHTCKASHVAARLQELTQSDELYRKAVGEDGNYVYQDSAFDESSGSPDTAERSA